METTTEPTTLALAGLVMRFANALNVQSIGVILKLLRETDMSLPRFVTLSYLYKSGAASISQICDYLNLALGTTSHVVDQLVQSGYVERREAEQDRRHKEVTLTTKGREVVELFRDLRLNETSQQLARLNPELNARLALVLEEVIAELRADP
ncbi:MAG: MarR family transcriptional regulator [Oscillochloris sp.]|nr:MarR family transcriptional regulator [Oscillochloris sp.]